MIVDPSRVVLRRGAGPLEQAGHDTILFTDASAALAHIRADLAIDALFTSLQPHGMSGLELCRQARALAGSRRPLYVLVMSSSSERSTIIEALDSGADDFIGKPPAPEELLARLRVASRVAGMQSELIRLATIDALTGALNRRAFFEAAADLPRAPDALDAVAIFDIDRFKQINDTYGHAAGDIAIQAVASLARGAADIVGRLGGEEFGVLLPGCSVKDAASLCEAMRVAVAATSLPQINPDLTVTCSFGAGEWRRGESIDDALKRADVALYAAKSGGRNRVIAATAPLDDLAAVTVSSPVRERRLAHA